MNISPEYAALAASNAVDAKAEKALLDTIQLALGMLLRRPVLLELSDTALMISNEKGSVKHWLPRTQVRVP